MEVDVPLLDRCGCLASGLRSWSASDGECVAYLQTSPEHAMKRLLAAGSGPIYQLGKVFRAGERGRRHLPEFTMLEWYRPGWSSAQLAEEVGALLAELAGAPAARHWRYRTVFERQLGANPHRAELGTLRALARQRAGTPPEMDDRGDWLDWLFASAVEPGLDDGAPQCVRDFPACQPELAQLVADPDGTLVADRFEVYWQGLELANGYGELRDVEAHRRRFVRERERRRARSGGAVAEPDTDQALLDALDAGLPACAGAALGVDRLLMLVTGAEEIAEVVPFAPL